MKAHAWIVMVLMALALAMPGCSKKSDVDTSKLEKNFQSADTKTQTQVNQAVDAIKNADYAGAMTKLQSVASQAKLTPEQQQAVKDTLEQLKTKALEATKKATEGANKALGDVQKSLPK